MIIIANNIPQEYPTNLSNAEWRILAHLIPETKRVVIPAPLIYEKSVTHYIPGKTKASSL
ncbi:hypothetical protein [uncultured Nostoc sp.]|uniref:hypothetical protein n=1 Tax=uncultured Nostoc sp. TaxID=340711 RepID=UPI0035CA9FAD